MPVGTKRKRTAPNGLSAGELLKRDKLAGPELYSQWGWISSIDEPSQITLEHRRAACGFYDKFGKPICPNKHRDSAGRVYKKQKVDVAHNAVEGAKPKPVDGEDSDDVIVISSDDEEPHVCTKKQCKDNPQCVNHLGQATLEKDSALRSFLDAANLGPSPLSNAREPGLPIGLKNLGATCYANAFIQVWFQDRAFRDGVYRCKPSQEEGCNLEDSPIFQLQTTFAALQESTQNVFNPVKLVESLQLRASEQQDAQEFSKLFMSHLATEFEKQKVPSLKTLLSDQFEGKQTYGTTCRNCGHRSEQDSDFLELEINLENNGKLEERVNALLQSEELTGDNKYYCTQCDGLQDATRYTKLQRLPPVLHISVLRFVFDLSSLSRKKSKQCILFPPVLDMSVFIAEQDEEGSGSRVPSKRTREELEDDKGSSGLIYELRGILLHKGPSAYHGHYEAQVLDSNTKQFYQFNDETVTPIASLQSKKGLSSGDKETGDGSVSAVANKKRRTYTRKKARVEDSEGEPDKRPDVNEEDQSYISSKDAYMLIYARRDELVTPDQIPEPPLPAKERVAKLNDAYDRACASYIEREKTLTNVFNRMRESKKSIYNRWEITDQREESAIVSRAALEAWIRKDLEKPKKRESSEAGPINHPKEQSLTTGKQHSLSRSDSPCDPLDLFAPTPISDSHRLDNSEIVCLHGRLDPRKANEMKRITNNAVTDIRVDTDCFFEPELSTRDVCEYCVQELFLDKRYGLDHPKHVTQFEEICESDSDSQGAWISKRWLADWRQAKPKMHISGEEDPPPDASNYLGHVRCVHDRLSLVPTSRKRINGEACAFLQGLFPTWRPLPDDAQACEACNKELNLSKETKQEFKKQAEDEKSKLRNLYSSHSLGVEPEIIAGVTQAIVPTDFLRQWRMWLGRPHEKPRPGPIDNSWLLCNHDRLVIDPNVSKDFGTAISFVFLSDWEKLQEIYGGGPLISLTGAVQDGDEIEPTSVTHDFEVCEACRKERLSNLDAATVTIRILGDDDPNPTVDCHEGRKSSGDARTNEVNGATASDLKRERPTRISTRLRKSRRTARRREIKITKMTTLKDIKIELHDDLDIPTICQRLFFNGVELTDNLQTLASLGVMANDTLYLREEKEQDDALNSDAEPEPVVRREEGRAFGGTVLGGYTRKATTPATDDDTERQSSPENACPACTFINPDGLSECSICGSQLNS